MTTEQDWQTLHEYKKLVRRGRAAPLVCRFCDSEVVTRLGEGDEVLFQCFFCDVLYQPGSNFLDILRRIVENYG